MELHVFVDGMGKKEEKGEEKKLKEYHLSSGDSRSLQRFRQPFESLVKTDLCHNMHFHYSKNHIA